MKMKEKYITKQIGNNIRMERKKQKLTQEQLAERSNEIMNVNTISCIERGIGNPKIQTLFEIAKGLGISLSEMMKLPDEEARKVNVDEGFIDYLISFLKGLKK